MTVPDKPAIDDLEDLYENAPCGYLTLGPDGRIHRANGTFAKWLGVTGPSLAGKRLPELLTMTGRMVYETHIAPLLRIQGGFSEIAIDFVTADGAKLPVIAHADERKGADGLPLFTRICLVRGTLRRRYEQQLVDARTKSVAAEEMARQTLLNERETSELREQFIAVLGHDLRNPLAAIGAGAHMLLRTPREPRETRILGMMETTVSRMSGLIDDILDFARGRLGGGITLNRDAQKPLEPELQQVVAELQSADPARIIQTDFAITEPVDCDRSRIGQLVSNVLGNALTHGAPDQPIRVGASTTGGRFALWIANGGSPIPEAALGRLFEPFFRGEVRDSRQGLGLGLYIASQIAAAHGGTLTVTSTAEQTCFIFEMPLARLD
ncbi:MAG: PAS domain-containing sensor histidine kinase [Tardiphaga sp.]